jgi:hypothetical protein
VRFYPEQITAATNYFAEPEADKKALVFWALKTEDFSAAA